VTRTDGGFKIIGRGSKPLQFCVMADAQDVTIASQHNDVEPKVVDADGHETDRRLADDKISIKSNTCERFSIRGYVATIRKLDRNTCWPFPQHLLETRLKEAGNMALPPLEIPDYRWWNCENCLRDISISGQSPCAKEYIRVSHTSMQACDGRFDRGGLMSRMHLPTSSVDIQEKLKENMLNDKVVSVDMQEKLKENMLDDIEVEVVETLTVELKSGDAVGSSAYETDKEKKDEGVVTDCIKEHVSTESTVLVEQENHKSEIADLNKNISGTSNCRSNSRNSEEIINMTDSCPREQDENAVCDEMALAVMETMSSMLLSKKRNEWGSKKNKSEEFHIPRQAPNSWEYFSRNKNVFKKISEKVKGKEREQAICPILDSEDSLDANKSINIRNVPVSIPYAENVEPGQQIVEGKYERTISIVEPLTVQTMKFNIQNGDDAHRALDNRNDVTCSNGNDSSCSDHKNINKITEVKECAAFSTSQASLKKENMLLLEQTGMLKVSESRSKRKPQKKRSISDIIASKPSCPESWNKEPEESWNKEPEEYKSNDEKEEIIGMTENTMKSSRPKEDHMKVTIDAVKKSSKPTIVTNGISEVNIDAEMNNVIIKKRRPEKLEVRKKQSGIGIEYIDACSTFVAKNSSTSSLSEAVTNSLQMPEGTSLFLSESRDKAPQHNFLNPEYEQSRQKLYVMEDQIPMDIVELMAKNQHERGLSNLKHFQESRNLQKERTKLKMKEAATSQANKHVGGRTGLKKNSATPKIKAQSKQTGKVNLQASSRNQCQSDLLVDYGQTDVSQAVRDNSIISNNEWITSISCEGDLARLPSTQWFNPCGKYSRDFVAPVLDETVSASNLSFPVDGTKSHVANTQCDQCGSFSTNSMVVDSMQLPRVSTYCGHMQMQNLCREATPPLSDFTGSVLPVFQNKFDSSLNHNGYSHLNLTGTDDPQNLTSESSHLRYSGKTFDILSESHKRNFLPNLSIRTDGGSGFIYFNGQSNSALLQQVNAQARQPFGKNYCFPSTPVLKLTEQSVSVPAKGGNEESMATENRGNRNFSHLSHPSSQKHVSWFPSSGATERNQRETLSGTERVFTGSEPIQDSTCMNGQITSSIKTIPPVTKFRHSGHYASNLLSGISMPSFAVNSKAEVALESSILRTKSPFRGTLFSGKKKEEGIAMYKWL